MEDEDIYLHYYEEENRFYDECGFPVFNIFEYVSPNMITLFKLYKEDMRVKSPIGEPVILSWSLYNFEN